MRTTRVPAAEAKWIIGNIELRNTHTGLIKLVGQGCSRHILAEHTCRRKRKREKGNTNDVTEVRDTDAVDFKRSRGHVGLLPRLAIGEVTLERIPTV